MINLHVKYFEINENFYDNSNILFIINNKKLFYSFLNDLHSNSNFFQYFELINEDNKKIKTSDVIEFVPSILSIDVNHKKNINSLIRNIKHNYIDDIQVEVNKVKLIINNFFKNYKLDVNIDIGSDITFDEDDFIKALNIFIVSNKEILLERIYDYIKVTFELRNITCFIFYNLFLFLDDNEIRQLLLDCKYLGVKLIDIECNDIQTSIFDKKYILDNDLCVLKKKSL